MNFNEVREQKKGAYSWKEKGISPVFWYKVSNSIADHIQVQVRFHVVRGTMQCVIRQIRQLLKP